MMSDIEELPKGWRLVCIDEVTLKSSTKTKPSDSPDSKFIGMDSIEPNSLSLSHTYSFRDFKSSGNQFEEDNVLYGRMRPYLNKVYQATFKGVCSGEFIVLNCTQALIPEYLKYILHNRDFVRFANDKTTGDRPRITYEEIGDYPVSLPPLAEQRRIVAKIEELFTNLDKGIETLKTAQQQLKIYRQSVLKRAFEGKLTNKDVKEGELPGGWKWVKSMELFDFVTSGSRGWAKYYSDSGSIFIRIDLLLYYKSVSCIEIPETSTDFQSIVISLKVPHSQTI